MNKELFDNENILITGATGLIGKKLTSHLINNTGASVHAFVRDVEKANKYLPMDNPRLHIYVGDVRNYDFSSIAVEMDYIVHAASMTSSRAFVEKPIETSLTSIEGISNILSYAAASNIKKMVYLSSMEVYGSPQNDDKINENHICDINTMKVRSSYPESKRMCESLCTSFGVEKGVPITVLRLTQTFGPGVEYNDERVFAEFARCAMEGRNIILKTSGETKRSYLHVADAVEAIICALLKGDAGEAYNVANESTYCSILEMANFVATKFAKKHIDVEISKHNSDIEMFAPVLKMNLDTSKIQSIGWKPKYGLDDMFSDMMDDM